MSKADKKGLAERVRARRETLKLSQTQLAEAVGMKQQGILNIEKGLVERPRKLLEISKVLCTTQEWLLNAEGPEEIVPFISKHQIMITVESLDPKLVPAAMEYLRTLREIDTEVA